MARSASGPASGIDCTVSVSRAVSDVEYASVSKMASEREGLTMISATRIVPHRTR
jgi:hypothetical protein